MTRILRRNSELRGEARVIGAVTGHGRRNRSNRGEIRATMSRNFCLTAFMS